MKEKILEHLKELLKFKDEDNFKKYGFSQSWNYYPWLKKVEDLKKTDDQADLYRINILHSLSLKYIISKGRETKDTVEFKKILNG